MEMKVKSVYNKRLDTPVLISMGVFFIGLSLFMINFARCFTRYSVFLAFLQYICYYNGGATIC